jgi:hypothetical protein
VTSGLTLIKPGRLFLLIQCWMVPTENDCEVERITSPKLLTIGASC